MGSGSTSLRTARPIDLRGKLQYDEDLVEAAVFLYARGGRGVPALQIARFQRERERRYRILDPEARQAAFFRLHLEWFREWGLEAQLTGPLGAFPLLSGALSILGFCRARRKADEGAELYVNATGARHAVVSLRPDAFAQPAVLETLLRHEFTHLHDMVDPAFGYAPDLPVETLPAGQQRLARDRYRLLWDITIDGRLERAGCSPSATRSQRWAEYARAFAFWSETRQHKTFDALWTASAPTHETLAHLASDPRELRSRVGPYPGAACPLCEFPTFHWADPATLDPMVLAAITAEFPAWKPHQGLCGRCHEAYHVATLRRAEPPAPPGEASGRQCDNLNSA